MGYFGFNELAKLISKLFNINELSVVLKILKLLENVTNVTIHSRYHHYQTESPTEQYFRINVDVKIVMFDLVSAWMEIFLEIQRSGNH